MNRQHPRPRLLINHEVKHKLECELQSETGTLSPDLQPASPPTFCAPDRAGLQQHTQFQQIGKYVISQASPSANTCTAVDRTTGEEYVCKVIPLSKYRQTLAPYLATDGHPHVVSIWEVILGQTCAYVFFQRGYGDLHSYIRERKRLVQAEARELAKQLVEAVAHCHDSGVLLRDLKLRKFIFKNPERTQLFMDGLDDAVVLEDVDASDVLTDKRGCPAYVSPEILSDSGSYSGKCSDIWSLGVMLYTILVGHYPFHDRDPLALFCEIRRGVYKIPDAVPARAKCLVCNLLRLEPSERLTAAEALQHPWFTRPILREPHSQSNMNKKCESQTVPVLSCHPGVSLSFLPV